MRHWCPCSYLKKTFKGFVLSRKDKGTRNSVFEIKVKQPWFLSKIKIQRFFNARLGNLKEANSNHDVKRWSWVQKRLKFQISTQKGLT